jgi:hypothetical protein
MTSVGSIFAVWKPAEIEVYAPADSLWWPLASAIPYCRIL